METIDINEVFAQANVVENLKNFAGIDAQNALGMMSQERLAAVVGGKLNIRYIAKELKPNETMQYNIYMCLAFLFDVNAYNSSAVFTKNYAALSILDDKLYGKYKVSATADFFTIENIGTSATVVSLVVLGR